jgi:phage tail-like protein
MDEQTKASRARFLGTVGAAGVAGAALAGGAWRTGSAKAAAPSGYSAGYFALQLNGGKDGGFLQSVEGGNAVAEVVHEVGSATYYQKKHIGNVRYEELALAFGMGMSKGVYEWISAALTGKDERKSGAIVLADQTYEAKSRREFTEALVTEVGFPAMDASSKDPAFMTLRIAPERTVDKPVSGKLIGEVKQQKLWQTSAFKFEVGNLPTRRVSRIEALTIKRTPATGEIGQVRDPQLEPGKLEYPNVVFTIPETDAPPWRDYFEIFVVLGENAEGSERRGRLTYLAPDLVGELGRLDFFNLGIVKLSTDKAQSSDGIARVKVELYCERIEFTYLVGASS